MCEEQKMFENHKMTWDKKRHQLLGLMKTFNSIRLMRQFNSQLSKHQIHKLLKTTDFILRVHCACSSARSTRFALVLYSNSKMFQEKAICIWFKAFTVTIFRVKSLPKTFLNTNAYPLDCTQNNCSLTNQVQKWLSKKWRNHEWWCLMGFNLMNLSQ